MIKPPLAYFELIKINKGNTQTVVGYYLHPPTVGKSFQFTKLKHLKSDSIIGICTTSTVTKITIDGFETLNSIYRLKKI